MMYLQRADGTLAKTSLPGGRRFTLELTDDGFWGPIWAPCHSGS